MISLLRSNLLILGLLRAAVGDGQCNEKGSKQLAEVMMVKIPTKLKLILISDLVFIRAYQKFF